LQRKLLRNIEEEKCTWMDWAIWVTKGGGNFKSLTVLLANTTTSESGSTIMNQCFLSNIIKIKRYIRMVPSEITIPEGFQVKASLYLWPSISMSSRMGTRFSEVGLCFCLSLITQYQSRKKERKELTSWTWQGFCRKRKLGFSSSTSDSVCVTRIDFDKIEFEIIDFSLVIFT